MKGAGTKWRWLPGGLRMTPPLWQNSSAKRRVRASRKDLRPNTTSHYSFSNRRRHRRLSSLPRLATRPDSRSAFPSVRSCAPHEKERAGADDQEQSSASTQDLMPGFIHSSPAMTRLVEEIYKIRSSDVTVLVTGESGTGKELVARAIHAHS